MDLADILRFLFYIWLLAAICYWAYRGYNRFTRGPADDLAERATIGTPDEDKKASAESGTATKTAGRRTMRDVLDQQAAAKKPEPKAPSGRLVDSVIKEEIAARKAREAASDDDLDGADDATAVEGTTDKSTADKGGADKGDAATSERRGLFAPADDPSPAAERAPVSTLLKGMDMPCDLVPLINADETPSPNHVVFVTTGHAPAVIGSSLGDELERLGFTLRSESDTEVVATRDADKLRVILHPDAATSRVDGERRFPSVPGGSVAVEFRS